jgi:hypothetical protein
MLGEVLERGVNAALEAKEKAQQAEAQREKEEKRKKSEERRKAAGGLSPASIEKKKRKEERDALRKVAAEQAARELERQKLPMISLDLFGKPSELAYAGAKSTIHHIITTTFPRGTEWGKLTKEQQQQALNHVKATFRNGADMSDQWLRDKISGSMSQMRYHDRMKIRSYLKGMRYYRGLSRPLQFSEDVWNSFYEVEVQIKASNDLQEWTHNLEYKRSQIEAGKLQPDYDLSLLEQKVSELQSVVDEVGKPPAKFLQAAQRISSRPKTTHKLGQGGLPCLKSEFVSPLSPLLSSFHFANGLVWVLLLQFALCTLSRSWAYSKNSRDLFL